MHEIATLGTTSAWGWIAVAVICALAELALGALLPLLAACAALAVALAAALFPGLGLGGQLLLFGALLLALHLGARRLPGVRARTAARASALAKAEAMIGCEAEVLSFEFHEGNVLIGGARWPARLDSTTSRTPLSGERMRVIATDGKVVWVGPL